MPAAAADDLELLLSPQAFATAPAIAVMLLTSDFASAIFEVAGIKPSFHLSAGCGPDTSHHSGRQSNPEHQPHQS